MHSSPFLICLKGMKKTFLSTLLIVLQSAVWAQGTVFLENRPLAEILAKAKTEGKLVFVDCYTTWCGPCKRMAAEVFPQQQVGDYMNPLFVSAKLDMEKGEGPSLGRQWDVNAYPTYVVLNAEGQVQFNVVGYLEPRKLIDTLAYELTHSGPTEAERRYQAGERQPELVLTYIRELEKKRKSRLLAQVVADYCNDHKEQLIGDSVGLHLFQQYIDDTTSPAFLYVYDHRDDFIARHGEPFGLVLESKWSYRCKSFYIMNDSTRQFAGYDARKMDEYEQFMKDHGVAKATQYVMSYKLPLSFSMNDKQLLLDNLEACASLPGISESQFNYGCTLVAKWGLTDEEQQRLARIREKRQQQLLLQQN